MARSIEELFDLIAEDWIWRRKELIGFLNDIKTNKSIKRSRFTRAGIVLLYAHWEGFIRCSVNLYFSYLQSKGLKMNEVKINIAAYALKDKIEEATLSSKTSIAIKLLELGQNLKDYNLTFPVSNKLETRNLKSDVLKEICISTGIDFSPYDLKSNIIDQKLIQRRNDIAHGRENEITTAEYEDLFKDIDELLCIFSEDIIEIALNKGYLIGDSTA